MMQPEDATLTSFEQRRLENIQRNNVIMRGMGIPALVPHELRAGSRRAPEPKPRRKRAAPAPLSDADTRDRRRSSRLANVPAVVFTTFEDDEDLGDERARRGSHATAGTARQPRDDGEATVPPGGPAPEGVAGPVAAGSSKGMKANVADMQAHCLGKLVEPADGSGAYKAAAMARMRGATSQPPRFNKYSGIQEFSNALALFVNVRGKAGSYANIFLESGRRMTWFAQPTQTDETHVVRRLLACTDSGCASPVVLFIREEGCAYVYAGRLRCAQYYPASLPLKLIWELLDYDALQAQPDFAGLLSEALSG